jgi:hypothetical protein
MTGIAHATRRIARRPLADLLGATSGVALLEFAFSMPLVMMLGLYAVETTSLAMMNLRVNQAALNLADNAARVGLHNADNREELREIDLNDVLAGARLQGAGWDLAKRGRITLSSLEEHDGDQLIHWQRCIGLKSGVDYDSHYGQTKPTDGLQEHDGKKEKDYDDGVDLKKKGMGPAGDEVKAPDDSGVMFVEINYQYNPIVSARWLPTGATRIHYTASFIVRDRRIFEKIYNPNPAATLMTCDKYTEA